MQSSFMGNSIINMLIVLFFLSCEPLGAKYDRDH